jgi:transcriptional regulator with XRE-family HTH domain
MPANELGDRLRTVRNLRGWSLREAAEKAEISSAYLQKLESGQVQSPSPHVLYSLAQRLRVPYSNLMELAGYVVPSDSDEREALPNINTLAYALSSEELTDAEAAALAQYLAWYRSQQTTST